MSTITIILVLVSMLFFLGMGGSFLLLLLIAKITAPRKKDGKEK